MMTEQEEQYIHFVSCTTWLNNAWSLLKTIQQQTGNSLIGPAFRFALIEYCKPYKQSHGVNRKFSLDSTHIPAAHLALHKQLLKSRDQVHAHSDLTVMDAKLSVHESQGHRYTLIAQNRVTGVEDLPKLEEVAALIEATLDNMYLHVKQLENGLPA